MLIQPDLKPLYPESGDEISHRVRFERADNRCEWCGVRNHRPHPETGYRVVLTVVHLEHDPAHNAEGNLAALCQRCHNKYATAKRHSNCQLRAHNAAGQLNFRP